MLHLLFTFLWKPLARIYCLRIIVHSLRFNQHGPWSSWIINVRIINLHNLRLISWADETVWWYYLLSRTPLKPVVFVMSLLAFI